MNIINKSIKHSFQSDITLLIYRFHI